MKILELCLSPDLGGLELYAYRCAATLGERHESLSVIAEGALLQPRLEREGLAYRPLKASFRPLPLFAARRLARIIDAEGIDILHMHWGKDLALAALAKRLSRRKPKLVYTRQMQITRPKRDVYHDFLYRQLDLVITITKALAEDMRRFLNPALAERIVPLYYGVAAPKQDIDAQARARLRAEHGIGESTFLIGLFGRIKHYKGQHLLVETMERAVAEGLDVAALIVGRAMEPAYLADLKRRCAEGPLAQRVHFLDFVDEPQALMQACDAIALTTVEETFGLVLVEAMRAGVAVIGSDRGGVPEIIDHGETGLLFRSGDAEDLLTQIRRLAMAPELCRRLAVAGREKADRMFDEALHFPRLEALFAALNADQPLPMTF